MRQFPASPITAVIDDRPRYNLGESCGRDLSVAEILTAGELADFGRVTAGYGTSKGDADLRAQIAARHGVRAGQVLITAGAASALFLMGLLFGDGEIVLGVPCFPPTLDVVRGIGADIRTVRARFGDRYRIDADGLRRQLSPATSLVMLASPQNPSALAIPDDDITAVLDQMARVCPDAYLLLDETFREAAYRGAAPRPSLAAASPRIVTCSSLSKAYGVPGLRVGWLTVPDPGLYEQLRLAKFNAAISCGSVDEYLGGRILSRAGEVLAQRAEIMTDAREIVEGWVDKHAGLVRWLRPEAGAFCSLELDRGRFPGAGDVDRLLARVRDGGTSVALGPWFGDSTHVLRLGLAYEPPEKLELGLEVISEALHAG